MNRLTRKENIIYAALWLLLFIVPAVMMYYQSASAQSDFPWGELLLTWRKMSLFLVMFLIHNILLAPILVYRRQRLRYFSCVAVLLMIFATVQCVSRPSHRDRHDHRPPMEEFRADGRDITPRHADFHRSDFNKGPHSRGPHQKPFFAQHDIMAIIMLILMLGMNIGVKLYFRHESDQQKMAELERENLAQQLEYLKYQLNPHFLMNTLNNIHALVDIDPETAKESIVMLSKIMRYVLYEGAREQVPLIREITFLENYIQLMRMRFTDHVRISLDLPERIPDRPLPPLLLISFVENAFKHGVSYSHPSFIDISIGTSDDRLNFRCRNSKVPQGEDSHGGLGLQNVQRRLDLLFNDRYQLDISDEADTYSVELNIPL